MSDYIKGFEPKKRKSISKKDRVLVSDRTNNKCGYCGIDLPDRWHLDHIVPFAKNGSKCELNNFMASCPQCNRFKSSLSLEQFRRELSFQVDNARQYSVNFRFAEKYEQVIVTKKPIVFYFEKIGVKINE